VDSAYRHLYNVGLEPCSGLILQLIPQLYFEMETELVRWKAPGSRLELANVAPRLLSLRDCILVVPGADRAVSDSEPRAILMDIGQYDPMIKLDDQAFIDAFDPIIDIIPSKQVPRKLVIRSYDKDFTFLLKGNEDLRGDERIMQLFKLINTLLNHQREAFSRNLHLLPYEVIPLSPSAGLLSWVANTQQSVLSSVLSMEADLADCKQSLQVTERERTTRRLVRRRWRACLG
jgi:FKBP12-rapamycin complex-associated protein